MLKTIDLPREVAARVIPGFCRLALEAACTVVVRQKRLSKGGSLQAVEDLIEANRKLRSLMAPALFDDDTREADVMTRLNRTGPWAGDAFKGCNRGAHELHDGDIEELVTGTRELAKKLVRGGL